MSGAEKLAQEKFQRSFQVGDAHVFIHIEAFDLVKLRAVRGVHFIAPIGRAGRNHADGRRRAFHGADLHGRGVGAEQAAVGQIKGVLLVARRMIGRGVERVEAMPFGFDVRTFRERETHPAENADRAIEHLGEGMQAAELARRCRAGRCRCSRVRAFPSRREDASALCSIAAVTALRASLRSLPTTGRSSLRERLHPLGPGGDAAGAAEIADARGLERLLVGRCGDFSQRGVAQLFQLVRHGNERCNVQR